MVTVVSCIGNTPESHRRLWRDRPVIKDLYKEHKDIKNMSGEEATRLLCIIVDYDLLTLCFFCRGEMMVEDLSVKQRVPPKPVMTFEHAFGDHRECLNHSPL